MTRQLLWSLIAIVLSLAGCANQTTAATEANAPSQAGAATLYVFNISGKTLVPRNQGVTDQGKLLVSLPLKSYKKIAISPGVHRLGFPHRKRPILVLEAVADETHYVVAGYNPAKSWAFPLAGDPLVIQQITEQEARPLFAEFASQ